MVLIKNLKDMIVYMVFTVSTQAHQRAIFDLVKCLATFCPKCRFKSCEPTLNSYCITPGELHIYALKPKYTAWDNLGFELQMHIHLVVTDI